MKKRIISLILTICTVYSVLYIPPITVGGQEPVDGETAFTVSVKEDGQEVADALVLKETDRRRLTASLVGASEDDKPAYQWQISDQNDPSAWMDIFDATGENLNLTYALVSSALDASGATAIRCVIKLGDKTYTCEPIVVRVSFAAPQAIADTYAQDYGIALASEEGISPLADDEGEDEYVTVQINYLDYETGVAISQHYTAIVPKGKDVTLNTSSPPYLGYAPYLVENYGDGDVDNDVFTDATTYTYTGIPTEDVTINIYYKVIEVSYAVRYYFQNASDDLYVENTAFYHQGKAFTGTEITSETINGILTQKDPDILDSRFISLYHYPERVAADGSTVFECYYDRWYHAMRFNLDGGWGVDPIYARYGTPYTVNPPEKYGYVFKGWIETDAEGRDKNTTLISTLTGTISNEDKYYRAVWEASETYYTVIWWLENADDDKYSFLDMKTVDAKGGDSIADTVLTSYQTISNDVISANHAAKFCKYEKTTYQDDNTAETDVTDTVTVEATGSTVINVYFKRNVYEMKFYVYREKDGAYEVSGNTTMYSYNSNLAEAAWSGVEDVPAFYDKATAMKYGYTADDLAKYPDNVLIPVFKHYDEIGDYKYYYFPVTAKYAQDITNIWPDNVLQNTPAKTPSGTYTYTNGTTWSGSDAVFSAWNCDSKSQYNTNSNKTIKGKIGVLDEDILPTDTAATATTFLAFWENAGNHGWNKPDMFMYRVLVKSDKTAAEVEGNFNYYVRSDGNVYEIISYYLVVDNNPVHKSGDTDVNNIKYNHTHPHIAGYNADMSEGLTDDLNCDYITVINSQTGENFVNDDFIADWNYHNPNDPWSVNEGAYRSLYYINWYYTANSNLKVHYVNEGTDAVQPDSQNATYGESMSRFNAVPKYPDTFEQNAYEFVGWYTEPALVNKYDFANETMPHENITLYAKWVEVPHNIYFFATRDDMIAYQKGDTSVIPYREAVVNHGHTYSTELADPTHPEGYTFGGWYYMTATNTLGMYEIYNTPIKRDMYIFADWSSHTPRPYRVHYALEAVEDDPDMLALLDAASGGAPVNNGLYEVEFGGELLTYIYTTNENTDAPAGYHLLCADSSIGFAFEGTTRTFTAKAGEYYAQLYEGYNSGYFPIVASHSITIAKEQDGSSFAQNNVFTFFYVKPITPLKYTVNYLYADTSLPIKGADGKDLTKNGTTSDSVVSERFAVVSDYIPDSFYKTLIITVKKVDGEWVGDDDANVLNFYYTKNTSAAYYAVHVFFQQLDGVTYKEDTSIIQGIGEIDAEIDVLPVTYDGFNVSKVEVQEGPDADRNEISANGTDNSYKIKIVEAGTDVYVYYDRVKRNVTVQYLEYNSTTPLTGVSNPIEVFEDQLFGSSVTYTAPLTIQGYTLANPNLITQTVQVRSDESQNYITFYYIPLQYTVSYQLVSVNGGNTEEGVTLSATMQVLNAHETVAGSKVTFDSELWDFLGWYDADGTLVSEDAEFVPDKNNFIPVPENNAFYAHIRRRVANLTITRENSEDGQVFVYQIQNDADASKVYFVTVTGNGSVTVTGLPCGSYTITQMNDWSWRYNDAAVKLNSFADNTTVKFSGNTSNDKWLNGNSEVEVNTAKAGG